MGWENWISTCERMKSNTYLILYGQNKLKWMKDLNIKTENLSHIEENICKSSLTLVWAIILLILKAQAMKQN